MKLRAHSVSLFEVGPRDGLQSQTRVLSLDDREELIVRLIKSGVKHVEVGSFVRDDRVPQLAGTQELLSRLEKRRKSLKKYAPKFWAFVPNMRGLENALATTVDGVAFFVAASDTFCRKNVNRKQDEIIAELELLIPIARKAKMDVRVYLSTITHCPYEGAVAPQKVLNLVNKLVSFGVKEIALGDTTGHATPFQIDKLLKSLLKKHKPTLFAMHLHDTRALALANVSAALNLGVRRFDSSVGGLGGCPYAPGAAGNLATEDLLYMLQAENLLKEKISLAEVVATSKWLEPKLGAALPSKVLKTLHP